MSCGPYQQHRDSGRPCNTPGSPRSCRLSEQNQIYGLNLNRDRSMTANVQFLQEPWPYLHGCCSGRAVLQVTNAQIRASDQHGRRWTRFTLGIIIVCCIEHLSLQFMRQKEQELRNTDNCALSVPLLVNAVACRVKISSRSGSTKCCAAMLHPFPINYQAQAITSYYSLHINYPQAIASYLLLLADREHHNPPLLPCLRLVSPCGEQAYESCQGEASRVSKTVERSR